MNILFAASEALPFVASGGLADVIGSLPKAINNSGNDCRVIIPLYKAIKEEFRATMTFLTSITVDVSWRKQYCGLFKAEYNGVIYYFIDNEYYFKRDGLYGYYDECERYAFFSRAVLEVLRVLDFKPDVLHAHDWQAALIPVYYEVFYKYQQGYENIRTVFTIHNIQYQGKYGVDVVNECIGIPMYHMGLIEYDGCINLMKGAFETADKITTVSPSYASEILDPYFSHSLDRCLQSKQYKLTGFLNGIDTDLYNPDRDMGIVCNYNSKDISGKAACKKALLEELNLPQDDRPVIAVVSRFVSHKGIDLIRCVFDDIINAGYKFVILGSGEQMYESFFQEMAWRYPDSVSVTLGYNPALSKKIYAGADMFLMPSQSEPCGLAQMIAMRYGTIPIVRETGGLRDSVQDAGEENGCGFTFKTINAHDMLDACRRAVALYKEPKKWKALMEYAMELDFSWDASAELYLGLYKEIVGWNK